MKKIHLFLFFAVFILLFCYGFLCTYRSLDPDFGWHLRTGQLILQKGAPHQDWYSYTMPNFPWIDHEWLTDVFIYETYSHLGFYFLLAVFLIIYTISFFIVVRRRQASWEFFLTIILGYAATIGFLGVRPQLLTVFFVAILLNIIYRFLENPSSRLIYLCPILFIIWVNFHGGFIIGLLILFLFLALEIFKKTVFFRIITSWHFFEGQKIRETSNKRIGVLLILLIVCFIFTFLNPYGPGLYKSPDFSSMGNSFLRFHIAEWMPMFFAGFHFLIYVYIGLFLGLLIVFYRKIEFNDIILSLAFLFFALSSIRNTLIFVIFTVPIICEMLFYLKEQLDMKIIYSFFDSWVKWVVIYWIVAILIACGVGFYTNLVSKSLKNYYPDKAVSFLKTLPLSENLFNNYGWGGYLIWKLPERKVFIDGRMPSWRQNEQFVFGDYVKIAEAQDGFDKILQKYNVGLVLISKPAEEKANSIKKNNPISAKFISFFKKHQQLAFVLGIQLPKNNLYDELIKLGWKNIYQDNVAVILEK